MYSIVCLCASSVSNGQYIISTEHLSSLLMKQIKCLTTFFFSWGQELTGIEYHAAVNTNNGTEAQNKVLKYRYLPKKTMTLSSIATIRIEEYLPDAQRKYVFQKFQQPPHYRSYSHTNPTYLHGCPCDVI